MSEGSVVDRCPWADHPDYHRYHDEEWGVPVWDDRGQFEFLTLESAQAGLSWLTILRKREGYREAFHGFDVDRVAEMGEADVERLMLFPGIVRNRLKIRAAIGNAQAFRRVQDEHGGFAPYAWSWVGGSPIQNSWATMADLPAASPEAVAWSKDLVRRGFKFVGPTILYAHMQAAGMVNDHVVGCPRHADCATLALPR